MISSRFQTSTTFRVLMDSLLVSDCNSDEYRTLAARANNLAVLEEMDNVRSERDSARRLHQVDEQQKAAAERKRQKAERKRQDVVYPVGTIIMVTLQQWTAEPRPLEYPQLAIVRGYDSYGSKYHISTAYPDGDGGIRFAEKPNEWAFVGEVEVVIPAPEAP